MTLPYRLPYLLVTLAYCAGIFWLSHQSDPPGRTVSFPGADKIVHAVLYAGLTATVTVGLQRSRPTIAPAVLAAAPIAFAAFYGLTDEIHQIYIPDRTFDLLDLAADIAGAALCQLVLLTAISRYKKREGPA